MFSSKIVAFARCVPENIVTNDDLSKIVETSDEWVFSRTGIKERRISVYENTSDLCAGAAEKAISDAGILPQDVDLIIAATASADFSIPSVACMVQKIIGAQNAVAFDINAACSGFVFALSCADKFIRTGAFGNAVVIGGETLSKIVDWNDRSTCVLFGDGAGACVIKKDNSGGILAEDLHSDGEKFEALTSSFFPLGNAFCKNKNENETSRWVKMNGREIFNFAVKKIPLSVKTVIKKAGLSIDDIKYVVPHQANSRIVEVIAKKLKMPMDSFFMNMDRYGNTSAASIPIALSEMFDRGLLNEGDKIVITGFGGGLTWGSVLLEI